MDEDDQVEEARHWPSAPRDDYNPDDTSPSHTRHADRAARNAIDLDAFRELVGSNDLDNWARARMADDERWEETRHADY
eukprot:16313627-Heterocapsa_arctica.AAC.1